MTMTFRFLVFSFLSLVSSWTMGQTGVDLLRTKPMVFTEQGIKNIQNQLDAINQGNAVQIVFRNTMFFLPTKKILQIDPKMLAGKTKAERDDLVASVYTTISDYPDFTEGYKKSDVAAQTWLNKSANPQNTLVINICVGLRMVGLKGKETKLDLMGQIKTNAYHKPYKHLTPIAGKGVPQELVDQVKAFCDGLDSDPNFNDNTFLGNDAFLVDIVKFFFKDKGPSVKIVYGDPSKDLNLDSNTTEQCRPYASYSSTTPGPGLPWMCIPATGTAVAIHVAVDGPAVQFKLSNTADFTLRSAMPDASSNLYISCNKNNASTAVIPMVDGAPALMQSLDVVAYSKRKLKVAVVYIEEENDDVQVVPQGQANLAAGTVVVSAGPNGFLDSSPAGDDKIITNADKTESITCGANGVCDSEAKNRNIKFSIHMDRNELEAKLNQFYNPLMVEWEVDKTEYAKPVNYDLNRNGYLEIGGYPDPMGPFVPHPEEMTIFSKARIGPSDIDHYLFVVPAYDNDDASDYIYGRTTGDLKSALIFASEMQRNKDEQNNSASMTDYLFTTCPHELGHAAFKFDDFKLSDFTNLMQKGHPFLKDCRLRKFQWDLMHQ